MGLKFVHEVPEQQKPRFLDLAIFVMPGHLCWELWPRSKKGFLNYSSAHSKVVKEDIATSCPRSAVQKTCRRRIKASVFRQVGRLECAGFPDHVVSRTCETLIRSIKAEANGDKKNNNEENNKKIAVVPYVHKLSQGLKNVAGRFVVKVIFFCA